MKKNYLILVLLLLLLFAKQILAQCAEEDNKPMDTIPTMLATHSYGSIDIPVEVSIDPNEIIGTKGYNAFGDTLQWVAVTVSLSYTYILFYKRINNNKL